MLANVSLALASLYFASDIFLDIFFFFLWKVTKKRKQLTIWHFVLAEVPHIESNYLLMKLALLLIASKEVLKFLSISKTASFYKVFRVMKGWSKIHQMK